MLAQGRLRTVREYNPLLAFDRRPFAYDRSASVRSFDADGRLHVSAANISKATVNEYRAEEIPGWKTLGLVAGRTYTLTH